MHIAHVIGFLFLLKIREILIFNIRFTAFIKILPVGELAVHSHTASTTTTGEHKHGITTQDYQGADLMVSRYASSNTPQTKYTESAGNHSHTVTINNTGSNTAHNNMQPYYACYIWRRTA